MNKARWLLYIIVLASCSYCEKRAATVDKPYVLPKNPFPSIMEQFYSYELPVYKIEIDAKSMMFDCTKRNDEELFWCGVDANLKYPDKNLPHKITMLLSFAVSKEGVQYYSSAVKNFRHTSLPVFLLGIFPSELGEAGNKSIVGKYYGIYNEKECMNWYGYFKDCPKGSAPIR